MERRNVLLGVRAFLPRFLLFCFVPAAVGLLTAGQQKLEVAPVNSETSLWWLVVPCAIALSLKPSYVFPRRLARLLGVTIAVTVRAWPLSVWLQETSNEDPLKAASVYHLPGTESGLERHGLIDSLQVKDRKGSSRIAGRSVLGEAMLDSPDGKPLWNDIR